ncbi:MAG TPA: hypothetical protein VMT20_02940 [Terriglobia bacterium]|nr:hypothetical protein [Terriglobia bacterium]
MNPTILGTVITSSGSILVAVVALVLNHRGFGDLRSEMNARFGGVEKRLDLIEHRMDVLEGDLKEFNKVLA